MADPNENDKIEAIKAALGTQGVDPLENVKSVFEQDTIAPSLPVTPTVESLQSKPFETEEQPTPDRPALDPGFQYIDEPSTYITRPIGTYDTITGTTISEIYFTDEERKIIEDSRESLESRYETITANLTNEQREMMAKVSPDKIEEDWLQQGMGLLNFALSPFNVPESLAWSGMAYAAQLLPNPESYLGDLAQSSFSAIYPYINGQVLFSAKNAVLGHEEEYVDPKQQEAFAKEEERISGKIYKNWADGTIYKNIQEGSAYEGTAVDYLFGPDIPMARGVEILDGMISKEEAKNLSELAKKAGDKDAEEYYGMLADETGREVIGFGAELVFDPLNIVGMAAGSKLVNVSGVQYTLQGDAAKAVDALTNANVPQQKASDLVVGALQRDDNSLSQIREIIEKEKTLEAVHQDKLNIISEKLTNPETIIDTAKADIQEHQATIQKLIDEAEKAETVATQAEKAKQVKYLKNLEKTKQMEAQKLASIQSVDQAKRFMTNVAKRESSIVSMHKRQVAQMSKILDDGYDASQTMQTAGVFRYHIPFGSKTYNLGQKTFKITPIKNVDTAASIANRTVGNVDDLIRLNKTTEDGLNQMIRNGDRITVGIGGGGVKGLIPEPIISRVQKVTNQLSPVKLDDIKSKVVNAGGSATSLTNGERLVYMMSEQGIPGFRDLTKYPFYLVQELSTFIGTRLFEPWFANRELDQAMQYFRSRGTDDNMIRNFLSGKQKSLVRLRKTSPELWNSYQKAIVKYNTSLSLSSEKLMSQVNLLVEMADDIAKARIADGTAIAGTTGLNVLNDAARFREQGVAFPEHLNPLRDTLQGFVREIEQVTGKDKEEVQQALQNIARFVSEDKQVVRDFADRILDVKEELEFITRATIKKTEGEIERLQQFATRIKDRFPKNEKVLRKQIRDLEKQEKALQDVLNNYRRALKQFPDDKKFTSSLQQSIKAVRDKAEEFRKLEDDFAPMRPQMVAERIKTGKDKSYARALENWELGVWNKLADVMAEYPEEDVLKAVLGLFKREPVDFGQLSARFRGTKDVTADQRLSKTAQFPTVIGTRFEDVPTDIQPLVNKLSQTLDAYTEMYRENGFDFIKDPVDMMRIFGVVDYVPHLRDNKAAEIRAKLGGMPDEERMIQSAPDSVLSQFLAQDAAKFRSLTGTIDEINQLVRYKGDQWEFTISPELLHSRLMQAGKGVASKEMLLTMFRTGVARVFPDFAAARESGFVPLLQRSSVGINKEVMLYGSTEDLLNAAGRPTDKEPFLDMLRILGDEDASLMAKGDAVRPVISWAQEIKDFRNVALVEQSVGIIRAVQARALSGVPSLEKFLINGEVLDVQKRWNEYTNTRLEEYLAKNKKAFDNVSKKIDNLQKKGKEIPPKLKEKLSDLHEKLNPDSDVYQINKKRIGTTAWGDVSKEINELLSDINRGEYPELPGIKQILIERNRYRLGMEPITAKDLSVFFDPVQPTSRLYIPETVEESLRMLTSRTFVGEKGTRANNIFNFIRKTNNFWKTRMTIISAMFTSRNVIGNMIANILDVGIGGVLNPDTNIKAGTLAFLIEPYAKYGSLEAAAKATKVARKPKESMTTFAKRRLLGAKLDVFWRGNGSTVDLGDGVVRTWDEALELMESRGVISGSANYRLDFETQLEEMLEAKHRLSMAEVEGLTRRKAAKVASKLEDVSIVALSAAATGGLPIAMTKNLGEWVARGAENQGRATNFIANLKRGGTVEDSVAHVNKFLLDYNDLTPRQKDYMRVLNPFFTWNFKNFMLNNEMMLKNPLFYSTMNRAFYHTLPMISYIMEQETEEEFANTSFEYMRYKTAQKVKYYPEYKMYRVRIDGLPFGLPKGYDVEGLGLPIESWAEYMQLVKDATDIPTGGKVGGKSYSGAEGFFARTHWLARFIYVATTNRDPFYKEDLLDPKMRDATDVANVLHTMRGFPELTPLTEYTKDALGVISVTRNGKTNYFFDEQRNPAFLLKQYTPNAIGRVLREGAGVQDVTNKSLMTPEGRWDESVTPEQLSKTWRIMNALFGFKVKQQANSEYLEQKHLEFGGNIMLDQMTSLGLSYQQEKTKVRK